MTKIAYATATSLDGYLADSDNSLEWLFAVEGGDDAQDELGGFVDGVGVLVMGSTTYEWVVRHESLLAHPEKWREFYGDRPTYVFTSRGDVVRIPGADIRFVSGAVANNVEEILAAAGEKDVWMMGGGDLAAQFAAAGHLDEIQVSVAPVMLGGGAPLFTGEFLSDRLELVDAHQTGQFAQLTYRVVGAPLRTR
jgi:dihydrofolate reductase